MNQTEAARSVLIEVANVLGAFKDSLVIVGGWVPALKYPGKNHVGSLDVDLTVGPDAIGENVYTTILNRLIEKEYRHETSPTRFYRKVPDVADEVKVDLISGQYVNKEKAEQIIVDGLGINTLRGVDLALEVCEEIVIEGVMPDGTYNTVRARIAAPEAFILIKAFALAERAKDKDAYDIAFILHHYDPSLASLAARLAPLVASGLGAGAYQVLTEKFSKLDSVGPMWAASVAAETEQDFEQAQRAAFENAQTLFDEVRQLRDG